MKAEIDKHGALHLTPELPLEEFALVQWLRLAEVRATDDRLKETTFIRGSMFMVHVNAQGPAR